MSKILILEDDEAISNLERDYLEINGYEIDISREGHEGLNKALTEEYDLLIVDIMLPGMDGFEICREIRKQKQIPILIVSARKDDIDKIRGLGLGADDYITKPFSPGELVARVGAHLARYDRLLAASSTPSHVPEGEVLRIRGLQIENGSHSVWMNEQQVKLTLKEFELLWILAKHPEQIFSKEELFRMVWNTEQIGDLATVAVHIKKLREKLEVDPAKPQYIETVWGVGYRFKL